MTCEVDPESHGEAVRRAYECRPDLREAFPLAYTPVQREAFAVWLFDRGRPDLGLTDQDIFGFLERCRRDPSQGLAETWKLSPSWQQQWPAALTFEWDTFRSTVAKQFNINARWLRRAKRPRGEPLLPFGVNILAHFRYPSGLQEEAVQYAHAIRAHSGGVSLRDAPVGFPREPRKTDEYLGDECYPITIAKLGVCESFDDQYPLTGWHPRLGVYRIAAWSWELAMLPRHVAGKADLADEIWTPSEFCAAAVRDAFPEKTVTAMLPAVSLPTFMPRTRSHFGLPAGFLFFFAFDIGSVMERKNPLGLIRAFEQAFQGDDRVHLAIKVTRGETKPAELLKLKAAARGANVTILDAVLPREELTALLDCCDCYVSLHRAEGFGFTIAEAMLLGKPTIATGYSANTEFMTDVTAMSVKYELVKIGPSQEPYPPDAVWAEPDLDHAAALMRRVYQHTPDAQAMGQRAKAAATQLLSPQAAGVRMMKRLNEISNDNHR